MAKPPSTPHPPTHILTFVPLWGLSWAHFISLHHQAPYPNDDPNLNPILTKPCLNHETFEVAALPSSFS